MNPFSNIPLRQRYSKAANEKITDITLLATENTVSLGSCFADHIMSQINQRLGGSFEFPGIQRIAAKHSGVHDTSRLGNLYTPRQIYELINEVESLSPRYIVYKDKKDLFFDALRPGVIENNYLSVTSCQKARYLIISRLLDKLKSAQQVILTYGFVENWIHKAKNFSVPVLPLVRNASLNADDFIFHKENLNEVISHIGRTVESINKINPKCHIILTVSPVPLMASMQPRHVAESNIASKSTLRAAIDYLKDETKLRFSYFPSYEIVTTASCGGPFLKAPPQHGVTTAGIDTVMSIALDEYLPNQATKTSNVFNDDEEQICEEYLQANNIQVSD